MTELGEIGQRWAKRAAKEMNTHHLMIANLLEAGEYLAIAAFVLNAATTGKSD